MQDTFFSTDRAGGWRRCAALATMLVVVLGLAISPTAAQAGPGAEQAAPERTKGTPTSRKLSGGKTGPGVPGAVNPLLGLLADPSTSDMDAWNRRMSTQAQRRAALLTRRSAAAGTRRPLGVVERERSTVRGANDTFRTAQVIPTFGSTRGRRSAARLVGSLAPPPAPTGFSAGREDNGSLRTATPTGLRPGQTRSTQAVIGDGPHGSAGDETGDFDFYALPGLRAGDRVSIDADTPASTLDTMVGLYDATGNLVDFNDDEGSQTDSYLVTRVPRAGTYFALVTGFAVLPVDPSDSGSGTGADQEGAYRVTLGWNAIDVDHYAVNLRPGDVVSAAVSGAGGHLAVHDTRRRLVFGADLDRSALFPAVSPLTGGGNAAVDHVVREPGRYYLAVEQGVGRYEVDLRVHRAPVRARGARQTIFLDFDGHRVDTSVFGGPGPRQLSPLAAFLPRWGLSADRRNALIGRVVTTVEENLRGDFARTGVRVKLLNSRDHRDPGHRADVTRIVVGGSSDEAELSTIGVAQSIDPGNFDTSEIALVLLDRLSASRDEASLNTYLAPGASARTRVRFIGTALGNITAHEAGHLLGNWHVDQENATADLMDAGGNFAVFFGLGRDGIGGTADDLDVDFGRDHFDPDEGLEGLQSTRTRVRWALHR